MKPRVGGFQGIISYLLPAWLRPLLAQPAWLQQPRGLLWHPAACGTCCMEADGGCSHCASSRLQGPTCPPFSPPSLPQRKPWKSMGDDVAAAAELAAQQPLMLAGVLPADQAEAVQLVGDIQVTLDRRVAMRWFWPCAGCCCWPGCQRRPITWR